MTHSQPTHNQPYNKVPARNFRRLNHPPSAPVKKLSRRRQGDNAAHALAINVAIAYQALSFRPDNKTDDQTLTSPPDIPDE
jgi:hypothetical protein